MSLWVRTRSQVVERKCHGQSRMVASIRVDVMAEANWPLFKVFGISKTRSHNKKNKDIGTIKYGLLVLWWGPVGPVNYDTTKHAERSAGPKQRNGFITWVAFSAQTDSDSEFQYRHPGAHNTLNEDDTRNQH